MSEERQKQYQSHPKPRNKPHSGKQTGDLPPKDRALDKFKTLIREEKGFANQELFKLSDKLGEELSGFTQENTTTQVRKFYNLVRVAKEQAEGKSAELIKIKLRILQAQVAYAAARGTISRDFKTFFDEVFKRILDDDKSNVESELKEFTTFFESLYAYFYYHVERRKNRKSGGQGR